MTESISPYPTISPYKTTLDEGNAYWMARLSKEVYLTTSDDDQMPDETQILRNLKKDDNDFVSVTGVNKNSAQAALVEHKEYLCMVFRGTNELSDWLDNINVVTIEELFGRFHRGFWNSVADVWEPIYEKYQALRRNDIFLKKNNIRPLFITGHSLGGAMATIAAAKLVHVDKPFAGVYTFGQPRTMARDTSLIFNAECGSRFFRFHNNNDLVTRIPARVMGYSHVGTYLYISEEKSIHQEASFWFKFVDYIDGAVEAVKEKGMDIIEDHNMDDYLKAVEKWDLRD